MAFKEIVNKKIKDVINKIDKQPFIVYKERDVQAMLYTELSDIDGNELNNISLKKNNGAYYITRLVHCEYPYGDGSGRNFDLVIFDDKSARKIDTCFLTIGPDQDYKIVDLTHAIEIKFDCGDNRIKTVKDNLENDVEKLLSFRNNNKETSLRLHPVMDN